MSGIIDQLAGGHVDQAQAAFSDESVLAFVERHGSAAPAEVAEVFGVSRAEASEALDRLVTGGSLSLNSSGLIYRAHA